MGLSIHSLIGGVEKCEHKSTEPQGINLFKTIAEWHII